MDLVFKKLSDLGVSVVINEPLCKHTSFKIGGDAKYFIEPKNEKELINTLKVLKEEGVRKIILGHGSNVLVSDGGINGAVIHLSGEFKEMNFKGEYLYCGAAVSLLSACEFAKQNAFTGLEFAYGIPASVGGAAYMNAGAYGGEMKDVIAFCEHITPDFSLSSHKGAELDFSYRHSIYTNTDYIITKVVFKLKKGDKDKISADMEDIMGRRKAKQPLEYPSAGSVFKRPQGHYAAALIEECGLKGYSVGGAQVSEKHSGFIINKGFATSEDVLLLIEEIKEKVYKEKGILLECEIKQIS